MKKDNPVTGYLTTEAKEKFEHVRAYYLKKSPGIPVSDSGVINSLTEETYQKIVGNETNANRITTIVEELQRLTGKVEEFRITTMVEELQRLSDKIDQLVESIKGGT